MIRARVEFKRQDCWIGIFWKRYRYLDGGPHGCDIWICLVPMFPLHVWWAFA
jgi:hypothetical protein